MLRRILLAAGCAVASAGCGTLANQRGDDAYQTWATHPPSEPYGGVGQDWDVLACIHDLGADKLEWGHAIIVPIALFDLPFSAMGDTALLPHDVWVTIARRWEQADADKPSTEK